MNINFKYGGHEHKFKYGGHLLKLLYDWNYYIVEKISELSKMTVKITILYFLYFLNFVSIKICYMKVHFAIIED